MTTSLTEHSQLPDLPQGTYCTSPKHYVSACACRQCGMIHTPLIQVFFGSLLCVACILELKARLLQTGVDENE